MTGEAVSEVSFGGLFVVVAVAFLVPLLLGAFPALRPPPVALEIVAGVLIGPSVLGLVEPDAAVEVLSPQPSSPLLCSPF